MKRGLNLDKVVLLGRTFEEYVRFFALAPDEWRARRILDVASGVGSFCAEANAQGWNVTATDPIYELPAETIAPRCQADLEHVLDAIGQATTYRWGFYRDAARLRGFRERARQRFLADYRDAPPGRYVAGQLPALPFPDRQFELTLVSYFLFVYEEQLSYDFHRDSLLEILRVTSGEARFYPLVTFAAQRSTYLDRLREDPVGRDFEFVEVATDFEFLEGSNSYLRVRRRRR